MFKEVQDAEDVDGAQEKVPDVLIEHGSTRVSFDLSAFEWVVVAIITAIVGLTVYLVS
tara:strand:+ start:137 stop:310 length:174 start_codon:yes stop_codon:yes gene_type:complete